MARSNAHNDQPHQRTGRTPRRPRTDRDHARRTLSQNFLTDPHEIARILHAARPRPGTLILEPGAGEGSLTRALARRAGKVIAYELDPRLADRLAHATRDDDRIHIVRADFTTAHPPRHPFAVVGNIPYSATARIVRWCLQAPTLTSATLVTQLEYARKRTGDYGRWTRLTVTTWPRHTWHLHGRIDRHSFRPIPKVDSAILRIQRRPADLLPPAALRGYHDLVALGFTGTGGTLRASLTRRYPARRVDAAFRAAGLDPATVVAYVHPDQWLTLYHHLTT